MGGFLIPTAFSRRMDIEHTQQALKSRLRKEIRDRRRRIDHALRRKWDDRINHTILERASQSCPGVVAAFLPFDGEPDLSPALAGLAGQGITVALPVIQDLPGKSVITFHAWNAKIPLRDNRYGISEPVGSILVPVPEIDLVLVPLVGWDTSGGRLGMGASFYDRLFQPFAGQDKPERVGVAYDLQKIDSVPCDPWDVRLHGMLTENGWFTFGG
jgi:5-formyltetrahydrofolate cyclo-ligase